MEDKWIVIVNVYAASKKAGALWRGIESQLKARGIDYLCHMTGTDGNACELAHSAAAEGYRRFVAVGGDGTVHDVLNGIMNYVDSPAAVGSGVAVCDFTLAVLPMGSGNDWIKSTGVPRDPVKALSMLASASFVRQDVVKVSLLDENDNPKSVTTH